MTKDGVGADNIADLRINFFQQGGYDVPHHGPFGPRSPGKEESKFESLMVSSKGPKIRSRAKFINLVTHLDGKGMCEGVWELKGNWSHLRDKRGSVRNWSRKRGSIPFAFAKLEFTNQFG